MGLAASADMPQVRAIVISKLEGARTRLLNMAGAGPDESTEGVRRAPRPRHRALLDNPDAFKRPASIVVPPGAPIGEPGWDWIGLGDAPCSLWDSRWEA